MDRLFLAVWFDDETRDALAHALVAPRRVGEHDAIRWVRREQVHVTLKFLGSTDRERASQVVRVAGEVAATHAPFTLAIEGSGAFPSIERPRVLWLAAAEGARELAALATELDAALAPLGFAAETRPFAAHLTLARVKADAASARARRALDAVPRGTLARTRVEAISLMRSVSGPEGPTYEEVARFPLDGARAAGQTAGA